ncbi:prepilin peptidase [Flavivirga aquimarina]|uniref:Prepilin peptidase n=1 Tax=Flavivirga aquimarina TaxID=2027862 RepID=A0ABT8W7A5_9FLAO|nr:prepilin peptidase [Flavivirga aquimarina]MDO5968993.1 prepilin peptidase [Flavivirga aquimarina]
MILLYTTLFLIVILVFVFFQDLKKRTIHVALPIILFLLALVINYSSTDLKFSYILYNIAFIIINILGVVLYFSLKNKGFVNPIDTYIGLGDIAFFLAITPLFNLKPFILFFVFGLLFSLLTHLGFMLFKQVKTIPLAGYLSLFLIVNIIAKNMFKINALF